jgi:hypothetical protein
MESNAYSIPEPGGLDRLAAVVEELAAEDLAALPDGVAAQRVLALRKLVDRLEGQWLRELAAVDGRGAAVAEVGTPAPSTAGWLRRWLRAGHSQASGWVRTARALYRGPWPAPGGHWPPASCPPATRHPRPPHRHRRRGRAGAAGGGRPAGPAGATQAGPARGRGRRPR